MMDSSNLKKEADNALQQYIEHGRGAENSVKAYSDSGAKYDQYMDVLHYSGPSKTAEAVAGLMKDKFDIKILDIGAGTGLAGVELVKLGYKNMDAVDAAKGLLEVARGRQIYGKIVCQFVGTEKMPFEDNSYDLAVSCGAVQENHIPREGFRDIIRVVKPGGYIVAVFRAEAALAPWYKEGLETYFLQLQNEGLWTLHNRATFPDFITGIEGLTLIYRVL